MYTSIAQKADTSIYPIEEVPSESKEQDPYEDYDKLYKRFDQAVKERDEAARELQRI